MAGERIAELGGWDTEIENYGFSTSAGGTIESGQLDLDSVKLLDIEDARSASQRSQQEPQPGELQNNHTATEDDDLFSEPGVNTGDPRDAVIAAMQAELRALNAKVALTDSRTKKLADWKGVITQASKDNEISRLEGEMALAWENGDQKTAYAVQKRLNEVQKLVVKDDDDETDKAKELTPSEKAALARLEANGGRLNTAIKKLVDRNKSSISESQVPFLKLTLAQVVSEGHAKGWTDKDILIEFAERGRLSITATPGKTGAAKPASKGQAPITKLGKDKAQVIAAFNNLHPTIRRLWLNQGFDREYQGNVVQYIEDYGNYTGE